jgi:replicative DNA helicase
MAADNEHRLISKIIKDRVIIPVLEKNISESWIVDDEVRRVFAFIRKHYTEYKEVPSAATVIDNFPTFKLYNVEDSIDYLIDKTVEFRRMSLTKAGLETAIEQLQKNDHESALTQMSNTVTLVNDQGIKGTNHIDLTKNSENRWTSYLNVQNHQFLGIPTGFERIDEATAGLQGGQLITIIAPPKTGKSQIALQVAINTHEAGHIPMFQSFEMNNHEQSQRHDSMRAHISNARLRRGQLKTDEEQRLQQMYLDMQTMKPFNLVDAINGLTIDALLAKAEQIKPDILFVDGVYLMMDQVTGESNTPQALTNITRGLKRVAQRLNIPVVITTQTLLWKMKGGKVSADSIGYSSSFFQDSDVILGLEPVPEDEEMRLLKIVQSRNAAPGSESSITWRWDKGCFHDETKEKDCAFCGKVWGMP